ncbi:hypothetical protein BpHYR1_022900 [Brachionus plicatilis]|uniref:Uncharacterized protein n=1 Tax=Brachionus plicatilis TaxID=10195 RepID=A0A3M7QGS3_BRAPC|nr:hypothetical protein BpHYR1_022900 [Brachionus plicatilis]
MFFFHLKFYDNSWNLGPQDESFFNGNWVMLSMGLQNRLGNSFSIENKLKVSLRLRPSYQYCSSLSTNLKST